VLFLFADGIAAADTAVASVFCVSAVNGTQWTRIKQSFPFALAATPLDLDERMFGTASLVVYFAHGIAATLK
jgi:hypothetical protein